jgi:hypothetical protein
VNRSWPSPCAHCSEYATSGLRSRVGTMPLFSVDRLGQPAVAESEGGGGSAGGNTGYAFAIDLDQGKEGYYSR